MSSNFEEINFGRRLQNPCTPSVEQEVLWVVQIGWTRKNTLWSHPKTNTVITKYSTWKNLDIFVVFEGGLNTPLNVTLINLAQSIYKGPYTT